MAKRTYGQYCALARAFDVVGERWTPLLLRELAMGPRRYADLQAALPGVGTSLLAQRLKELEADGVVRRRFLSPPAARWVYDLSDDGHELAAALVPLARWGVKRLGAPQEGETFSLSWMLLFIQETADKHAAAGVHDLYEFHSMGHVFHVSVEDGVVEAQPGPAPRPPEADRSGVPGVEPGRYLWLRIHLTGDGYATPVVGRLWVYFPRQTYLEYLPAVYSVEVQTLK